LQKNYISKIYPPGGIEIKKIGGGFLRYVLMPICGYFNRGRGTRCPPRRTRKRKVRARCKKCVSNVQIIDYRDMGLLCLYFGGSGIATANLSNIVRDGVDFVSKNLTL
jgi:hypothetical protein